MLTLSTYNYSVGTLKRKYISMLLTVSENLKCKRDVSIPS